MKKAGWLGEAKVSCILRHQGVQLILAYSWARPALLSAGMGRGEMFNFFCVFNVSGGGWVRQRCRVLAYSWARPAVLSAGMGRGGMFNYAPAYSKNSGRALSVTPVRPLRTSVPIHVRAITPKPYGIFL